MALPYTDVGQLCWDICNSERAVAALSDLHAEADADTRRAQTALRFVRLGSERQAVAEFAADQPRGPSSAAAARPATRPSGDAAAPRSKAAAATCSPRAAR